MSHPLDPYHVDGVQTRSDYHGHFLHVCDGRFLRTHNQPTPDLSITIQRTGGGAAPIGFIALADGDNDEILAQDWSEEACYHEMLRYLFDGEYHPSFQCNTLVDFPSPPFRLDEQ